MVVPCRQGPAARVVRAAPSHVARLIAAGRHNAKHFETAANPLKHCDKQALCVEAGQLDGGAHGDFAQDDA